MNFKHFTSARSRLASALVLLAAAICWLMPHRWAWAVSPPPAQFAIDEEDPFGEVDADNDDAPAGDGGQIDEMLIADEDEPAGDTGPTTPEKEKAAQLLGQYLALKPQARQPASVLQALAARSRAKDKENQNAKPNSDAARQQAEQRAAVRSFVQGVAVGDWAAIKGQLADLPPEIAPQVYNHLLQLLNHPEQPAILLPGEILPLADASPKELTPQQLVWLGALLKKSLHFTAQPLDLMARLNSGTERLGGKQPKRRLAAARLLLTAGLLDEAGQFVPTVDQALRDADGEMLNLLGDLQQARAGKSQEPIDFVRAWDLTQTILVRTDLTAGARYVAVARALRLLSAAPEKVGDQWLQELFQQTPDLGMFVLAQLGSNAKSPAETAPPGSDSPGRLRQRVIAQLLLAVGENTSAWTTALNMLTAGWIEQAERVLASGQVRTNVTVQMSGTGLKSLQQALWQVLQSQPEERGFTRSMGNPGAQRQAAELLAAGPDDRWLAAIDPDVARKVRQLQGLLAAHAVDEARVLAAIDAALPANAEQAKEIAERFLGQWANSIKSSGNDMSGRGNHSIYTYNMRGQIINSDGETISLTRARQVRNLAQYAELLAKLKSRELPTLKPETLTDVFDACHSAAEIYRETDMQQVFGPPEDWSLEVTVVLVAKMREKLAGQWRNAQIQDRAGTHRTDKEQVAEVVRGYAVAGRLLDVACGKAPARPELELLRAIVDFDQSEFAYGQQVPLEAYTKLRDRAFAGFKHAAELYAATLKPLAPERQSVAVYRAWFQAALGASDLAYLLPNHKTDLDQIGLLREALASLPEDLKPRHLEKLGETLRDAAGSVPGQLKPRYYREVVRVLADHPSADAAREKLAFYEELLAEVCLHLAVDGSADVGHSAPFGVQLAIRSTDTMARESGNFAPLLQSLQTIQGGNHSRQSDDVRKKLEAEIKDKLGKTFVIKAVRFHDPNVKPRSCGREGWLETPLGYLLLQAKDPSADRIEPIELDMTFNDGSGEVLLPIASPVVLVNANTESPPVRPLADVKVKQLLDDRQLTHGLVRLEISASAKGILGKLDDVLDVDSHVPPGFAVKEIRDQDVEIVALDAADDQVAPVSERTWMIDFEPLPDASAETFAFLPAREPATQLTYEHYADADLVECASRVALRQSLLPGRHQLWILAGSAAAIALVGVAAGLLWRLRRRATPAAVAAYRYPAHVTAFNLLLLLKRIQEDSSQRLAESERVSLSQTVAELERRHFAPHTQHTNGEDLHRILERWLSRVGVAPLVRR
jgi:hypothetical protein